MLSTSTTRIAELSAVSICDLQSLGGVGWSMQPSALTTSRASSRFGFARVSAPSCAAPEDFSGSRTGRLSHAVYQRKLTTSVRGTSPLHPLRAPFRCGNGVVRAATGGNADADSEGSEAPQLDFEDGRWKKLEKRIEKFGELLSAAFPLWVGLACVGALALPDATLWIGSRVQVVGLTITMLGMGMTLTLQDFQAAFALPKELLVGVVLQYTVMPSAGYAVSRILQLPPHYAAGLILVACCPGGTASNIVTYLARGNVALSVLMTAASTFLAVNLLVEECAMSLETAKNIIFITSVHLNGPEPVPLSPNFIIQGVEVMTPVLTSKLAGQYVAVDASALFSSTVQVVLLPVLGGAILNSLFHRYVKKIALVAPTIAVFIVAILVAGAVGRNAQAILASGGQVVLAVMALHSAGFAGGYILSRLLRIEESSSRTISIEVGMQNSVLGVVLAGQHFSNPLTAVPCAVSSVCHSLIGSTLAGVWRLAVMKGNVTQHAEPPVEVS